MRRLIAVPVLALAGLTAGCATMPGHTLPAPSTTGKPACTSSRMADDTAVVYANEDQELDCDVRPPQELVIHMLDTPGKVERCLDMGGEPISFNAHVMDCEKVDY